MPALVDTLKFIWNKNAKNDLFFIISSTIRNEATYNAFIKNLGKLFMIIFQRFKIKNYYYNQSFRELQI